MGIVVCLSMLLGLSVLQPTPWESDKRSKHHPRYILFASVALLFLGVWNFIYGYLNISGFWQWASMVSGSAMVSASYYVFSERHLNAISDASILDVSTAAGVRDSGSEVSYSNTKVSAVRRAVVAVLAVSFLVYAVTLIQLNLGYSILR